MIVKDLDEAERIVANNPNLYWDGWDIVYFIQDDYAEFLRVGFMDKKTGKWYKRSTFKCQETGWDIPDTVIL